MVDESKSVLGRATYLAVAGWFVLVFGAMIWPGYLPFAKVRPLVLGIPFGLFYYAALLAASFGVLLGLYRWEISRGLTDGDSDDA